MPKPCPPVCGTSESYEKMLTKYYDDKRRNRFESNNQIHEKTPNIIIVTATVDFVNFWLT